VTVAVIFQKIYEKHVTFGGRGAPRGTTICHEGGGGSKSGLKRPRGLCTAPYYILMFAYKVAHTHFILILEF